MTGSERVLGKAISAIGVVGLLLLGSLYVASPAHAASTVPVRVKINSYNCPRGVHSVSVAHFHGSSSTTLRYDKMFRGLWGATTPYFNLPARSGSINLTVAYRCKSGIPGIALPTTGRTVRVWIYSTGRQTKQL